MVAQNAMIKRSCVQALDLYFFPQLLSDCADIGITTYCIGIVTDDAIDIPIENTGTDNDNS